MNKGLARASGEWVLFLHADDSLVHDSVAQALEQVARRPGLDVAGFPIRYGNETSSRLVRPRGGNAWMRVKTGYLHQGTLIRRRLFDRVGDHDPSLGIAMDYDFFLRAWLGGACMATFRQPVLALM